MVTDDARLHQRIVLIGFPAGTWLGSTTITFWPASCINHYTWSNRFVPAILFHDVAMPLTVAAVLAAWPCSCALHWFQGLQKVAPTYLSSMVSMSCYPHPSVVDLIQDIKV